MTGREIRVTLPDGSEKRLPAGATGADLARAIGPGLAKAAVAIRVDGQVWDLARALPDGMKVAVLTDKDPQALDVLRHSSAHVLATAVRQLFPHAKIGFGPPIEDGFYYDFAVPTPFTPEDLERIEAKMHEVVKADYPFVREEVNREEAKRRFTDDPLKLERIDDLGPNEVISVYTDGPFVDLCRGPHVASTGRVKHSSCCTPRAPTGAATSAAKCCSASTARRGSPRRTSRRTYGGWKKRASATTACSASSSICSRSRKTWDRG